MSEVKDDAGILSPAQAVELALLVDLEACWENQRLTTGGDPAAGATWSDLQGRQKAYDAYRARLATYNSRYAPAHLPELLLNTPSRLGAWCRKMRDLYRRVEHDPKAHCPAHLLEKAYRRADRIGVRLNRGPVHRAPPPTDIRDAAQQLEALSRWCEVAGLPVGG